MSKNFSTIFENFMNRFSVGGFLPGDLVKLKKNAVNCKGLSSQHKDLIRSVLKDGTKLRVVNIQAKNSNLSFIPSGTEEDYNVILAPEISPGLNGGTFTVPMSCIELISKWEDSAQQPFDNKYGRNNEHEKKINSNEKFSDTYDSGKGSQEDFGKK